METIRIILITPFVIFLGIFCIAIALIGILFYLCFIVAGIFSWYIFVYGGYETGHWILSSLLIGLTVYIASLLFKK